MTDDECRGWSWRSCRAIRVALWLEILPWQWRIGSETVSDTYTEFRWGCQFGPLGLQIIADTGNSSDESWRARFGLSDEEAWERSKP